METGNLPPQSTNAPASPSAISTAYGQYSMLSKALISHIKRLAAVYRNVTPRCKPVLMASIDVDLQRLVDTWGAGQDSYEIVEELETLSAIKDSFTLHGMPSNTIDQLIEGKICELVAQADLAEQPTS
ncbi:MAG: hypothetical protein Q9184_007412, partial [Pyrenodesmia sp. 2 TL-2023]